MSMRELLLAVALALGTTWALQYFLTNRQTTINPDGTQIRSGQRFSAPKTVEVEVHKPLNTEIDFIDTKVSRPARLTTIETKQARYEFSSDGAVLNSLEFKRNWAGKEGYLATVFPPSSPDRERGCFLVGLQSETPYYFELVDKKEEQDRVTITYQVALSNHGILTKQFIVFRHEYRIDLILGISLNQSLVNDIQPRIFFSSPLVPELAGNDMVSGISNDERNHLKIFARSDDTINSYWSKPTLFGAQDRYFVHAMVNDPDHFVQRGYYKAVDIESLYSILEGPSVSTTHTWHLTFYVGPKEDEAMNVVDPRLEETLNYGWFSFISKPLSKTMLWSLNKIYDFVHNYGLAIIILTIIFKLLLLPFTWKNEQGLQQNAEFGKKLEYIQQKYKHDPELLAQERTELIRKYGMPGLGGCLPQLLQLPIFWALSIILANAIELYQAPFLWIPDLSSRDPYFILPILMAIGMIIALSPRLGGGSQQQRISSFVSALVVGALMSNFAAGLVLFICVTTWLGVVQSLISRRFV